MFDRFAEWYNDRHDYARAWKEKTGGKVMGYFCTYVPEEILVAADILPVRILGSHEPQSVTEPHIFGMFCPFCRDCLAQGLKGRYEYLDGLMIAQSCLHIRQAFTSWIEHVPVGWSYYLPMPNHVQSKAARPYLIEELRLFKKAVQEWTGRQITEADLDRGIEVCNDFRSGLHALYETRKVEDPPLNGVEAMYTVVSGQLVDKAEHATALKASLAKLDGRARGEVGVRLMILGSENDDIELVEMVESCGSTVVADDHCTGTRYFWNNVDPVEDRLAAIAERYLRRPPCPSKDWPVRTRVGHILDIAEEWNVQGAVILQQKFCDPHEADVPAITESLKAKGIPTLFLELDVTVPVGQFKTRADAFLEMIWADELF
ncbi:MAG: benzoyl-CoA reductase, bzd-type, subunit N [Planctomycetota bacterium]|jgi:benzoyl-CoA reductase subunit C